MRSGFGGFCQTVPRAANNYREVGHWSGNGSTLGTTPNRTAGAVAPSLLQTTPADQPQLEQVGSVQLLHFDGANSDLSAVPSVALKALVGPRVYWAWHVRTFNQPGSTRTVWAEWGTTERFQVAFAAAATVVVSVAISAVALATATFTVPLATQQAGMFLEVFYDGQAAAGQRIRLFVNLVEVSSTSTSGTVPIAMLAGDASANWLGSLNGASNPLMQVAHFYMGNGLPTPTQRAAIKAFEEPPWVAFLPSQLSTVLAWLSVAGATSDVNGISSVPDLLNSNPATQSVTARKPVIELSSNGAPCMRFATNDVLVWPITPQSAASSQAGWGLWVKLLSATGGQKLVYVGTGTNAASAFKLSLQTSSSQWRGDASDDGVTVKNVFAGTTSPAGVWHFLTLEYDEHAATDAERMTITADGVVLTSASTPTLGALFPATGNVLIGNAADGVGSLILNAAIGPHLYAFGPKMSGASLGLLSTTARLQLMNYLPPI